MRKILKKLLSFLLCLFLALMAFPLISFLETANNFCHNHHECAENHYHDCEHDHAHNKGFWERLFFGLFPSAHASSGHVHYQNTKGCRTHHWCSWGHAECEYDTYNHQYNAAGYCIYCGTFGGHTHSFTTTYQSQHPHAVYCTCACGYSYINGYRSVPSCLSCYPCTNHSWQRSYFSSNNNGTHQIGCYCTICLSTTSSTETCSLSYSGITATGGGTHKVNNSCACGYMVSSTQACSGGKATTTAPANCSVCGSPYGSPDPCADGHDFYAYYCDAEHPHANYDYCKRCSYKQYDGTTRYKSNCKICNPDLECLHTAETFTEFEHPHKVICRGCCEVLASSSYLSTCSTCNEQGVPGTKGVLTVWATTNLTSINDSGVLSIEHAKEIDAAQAR